MIALLLFAQVTQPVVGPEIPAGTNSSFQQACLAVEEALEHKDFAGAEKRLLALPKLNVTLQWDDKSIPAARRGEFAKARDESIADWTKNLPELKVAIVPKGRIKLSFAPSLPANADSPGPAGAVYFSSIDPGEPAVEGVIALVRTEQKFEIDTKEVRNEVGFAIGSYLGLERMPHIGSVMSRSEQPYRQAYLISSSEVIRAREVQKLVAKLTDYVKRRVVLTPAKPEMFLSQTEFKSAPVVQGEPLQLSMSVTNRGNAPLTYHVLPDCSCFSIAYDKTVAPGATKLVQFAIDTIHYTGDLDKTVLVQSNDAEAGVRKLHFSMRVDPLYRFLGIERGDVQLIDESTEGDLYFIPHAKSSLTPTGVEVEGVNGSATIEPWEGAVADREMNEPSKARKGYRIHYKLVGDIPPGRAGVGIVVRTGNTDWDPVRTSFYVQRGIVALPISVYMGELSRFPARAWCLLSRPGKPFKVVKIESDHKLFSGEVEAVRPGEYKLNVLYAGGADFGDLNANLTVHTDDPKQPTVQVPIRAVVRG
jgi:hypothetical protein